MIISKDKEFNWKPKKGSFRKIQESYLKKEGLLTEGEATPEQMKIAKKYGFDKVYADEIDVDWIKKSGVEKAWNRKKFDPALMKIAKQVKKVVDKNGGFDNWKEAEKAIDKAVKLRKPWRVTSTIEYGYGENMGWAVGNGDLEYTFPEWEIRDLAVNQELKVDLKTGKMGKPTAIFGGRYYPAPNKQTSEEEGGRSGFFI